MENGRKQSKRSPPAGGSDSTPGLSDDRLYRALASTLRRRLLSLLLDGRERTVEEVATELTGWEATERGTMGTPQDRERIVVALEHRHLPHLAEAGLVTYDRADGSVQIRPLDPRVRSFICGRGGYPDP